MPANLGRQSLESMRLVAECSIVVEDDSAKSSGSESVDKLAVRDAPLVQSPLGTQTLDGRTTLTLDSDRLVSGEHQRRFRDKPEGSHVVDPSPKCWDTRVARVNAPSHTRTADYQKALGQRGNACRRTSTGCD